MPAPPPPLSPLSFPPFTLFWVLSAQIIMIVNELMEESWVQETPAWNKENNPAYNNTQLRKKHLKTLLPRPTTPLFQATFNPYPHHNGFSIPIIAPKRTPLDSLATLSDSNDIREGLAKLSLKQKPVIAKSNKLKDFFALDSARYVEGDRQDLTSHRFRGRSLNALSVRRQSLETLPNPLHKISSRPTVTRKQEFERLYLKQREAYQRILVQYGVLETISDQNFTRFINSE